MRSLHRISALGLLCVALPAQNYTVSPATATAADANTNNTIPWRSMTTRYQQIHNDTRGNVWVLQGISLRREGSTTVYTTAVARTVDVEAFVGDGSYSAATGVFATNYTGTPAQVVNRKNINLPDFTLWLGSPAPWSIVVPFDTPWLYAGVQDLVWELLVYSTTSTGSYFCDAHTGLASSLNGALGNGCLSTGKTGRMAFDPTLQTTADVLRFGWTAVNAPNTAVSVVLVGTTNPNLPIPGLCTNLYANPLFAFAGITSATGILTIPTSSVPFDPSLAGASIYSQAFSDDPGQSGIPLAGSQGSRTTIANPPPFRITRIWVENVSAVTGSRSEFYPFGLVVRFTHQ